MLKKRIFEKNVVCLRYREFDTMTTVDKIDEDLIQKIRSSIDIVDVISGYLPLTGKGKNYFGVCPFHDDHSPSMSVSKEKQIYHCFSCGAGGNVFKFVMDYEHISFLEAIKMVADKVGIPITLNTSYKTPQKNQILYEIYELGQKFYQNNINTSEGKEARDYLEKRSISKELIKEFGIGLALPKRDILAKLLLQKQYDPKELLKTGLITKNDYGYQDLYYNRIMFPLWDLTGQVVGYSGRIYNGTDSSKYINTRETEIFKKGELIYNYHRAKDAARLENQIIVMEGFMDVIRAYSVGITNTIAMMGTAVTKAQANLIKRMGQEVILCFDGDEAGAKATLSCSNELLAIGVTPKIVRLEDNMDPDDYILKFGKEKFLRNIQNPISVMDFKFHYLKKGKDLSNQVEYSTYIHTIIDELAKITDPVLKELTLQKLSSESKLDMDLLRSELEEKTVVEEVVSSPNISLPKQNKYRKAEENLLYCMLNHVDVIQLYHNKVAYMPTEEYRKLANSLWGFYHQHQFYNLADFFTEATEENQVTMNHILKLNRSEDYTKEELEDYIRTIKEYNIKYECKRVQEKIRNETDPLEKAKLAQRIVELRKINEL